MGRGERVGLAASTALLLGLGLGACTSSTAGPDTDGSSPGSGAASATMGTESATPPASAASGTPRPRLFPVPSVLGETMNRPNCIVLAPVEGPADPGPQGVALTADNENPGFTYLNGTSDFTAVSSDGRTRTMVKDQEVDVNVNGTASSQPLNGEPVIVEQDTDGDGLIYNGTGAPLTACEKQPDALSTFERSVGAIYHGPVIIVTMGQGSIKVSSGSV